MTVYVNYNSSKAGNTVALTLAKVNDDNTFTTIDTKSVEALKTGDYKITFNVADDGNYIIYLSLIHIFTID